MAAPLPINEAARLSALGGYHLRDTAPENAYDDIVRLAAFICGTPIAAVSLVDAQRQWYKSALGLSSAETSREDAFCAHTILQTDLMVVPDAAEDTRFTNNPLVTGEPHIRFYAGMPLIVDGGYALGSLCVIDSVPRLLTDEQQDALRTLARQVVTQMELGRRTGIQEQLLTERERAVAAQRQSEERFRAAFENAALGASIFDLNGHFLSVNPAFCGITAYPEEVLRDTDFMALTHPDDLAGCLSLVEQLQAGQIPSFVTEKRFLRSDGGVAWVQNSVSLLHDAQGRPEYILALTEDITDRKVSGQTRAEAEWREVEALKRTAQVSAIGEALRSALTVAQVADVILRSVLPLFHADEGMVVLLSEDGVTLRAAQITGLQPSYWREFPVEAHRPLADAVRDRRLIVFPIDEEFSSHYILKGRRENSPTVLAAIPLQGSERCVGGLGLICSPERLQDGDQKSFLWALADQCAIALERALLYDAARNEAAERRQAEEALRHHQNRLVEAQRIGGIGDWGIEVGSRRLIWSLETFRILGFDPALGIPAYDEVRMCFHPDDRAEHDRLYALALSTREPFQIELRFTMPDGRLHWCHMIARPEVDAHGVVTRIGGTLQDITQRVEREQQLREANLALEAANAELKALATTDPLTGLLNHRAFQVRLTEETERAQHNGTSLAIAILDLDGFRFFNDVYGHAVGDTVLCQVAGRLKEVFVSGEITARFGGDEFAILFPNIPSGTSAVDLEKRLRRGLIGLYYKPVEGTTAVPLTAAVGAALSPAEDSDGTEPGASVSGCQAALRRAEERLWRAKTGGEAETEAGRVRAHALRSLSGFSMLDALVTAVDNKDRYTRRHSEDVLGHALLIARELGLTEAEQRTVAVAALLHDVGKIGVPDAILRKPGGLTEAEYEAVRRHPQMGAMIVQAVPGLEDILDAVCHHHERWDGGGYPFGLRGTETPLTARLLSVADAFSAMTTDRPYRRGMDRGRALSVLEAGAGTQWDRRCVEAFLAAYQNQQDVGIGF